MRSARHKGQRSICQGRVRRQVGSSAAPGASPTQPCAPSVYLCFSPLNEKRGKPLQLDLALAGPSPVLRASMCLTVIECWLKKHNREWIRPGWVSLRSLSGQLRRRRTQAGRVCVRGVIVWPARPGGGPWSWEVQWSVAWAGNRGKPGRNSEWARAAVAGAPVTLGRPDHHCPVPFFWPFLTNCQPRARW